MEDVIGWKALVILLVSVFMLLVGVLDNARSIGSPAQALAGSGPLVPRDDNGRGAYDAALGASDAVRVTSRRKGRAVETFVPSDPSRFRPKQMRLNVAVCVTGNERAVGRPPVRESMGRYITAPIVSAGGTVDYFLVVGVTDDDPTYRHGYQSHARSYGDGEGHLPTATAAAAAAAAAAAEDARVVSLRQRRSAAVRETLRRLWRPTVLIVGDPALDLQANPRNAQARSTCNYLFGLPANLSASKMAESMAQESKLGFFENFRKVLLAYEAVEAHERALRLGPVNQLLNFSASSSSSSLPSSSSSSSLPPSASFQYDWILRVRTDLVFFSPVPPLHALDRHAVYVPRSGKAANPRFAFMNDHVFICPRDKCAAYFHLFHLFQRCNASLPLPSDPEYVPPPSTPPSPSSTMTGDGGSTPNFSFHLNPPPEGQGPQWWFFRRYGGSFVHSPSSSSSSSTFAAAAAAATGLAGVAAKHTEGAAKVASRVAATEWSEMLAAEGGGRGGDIKGGGIRDGEYEDGAETSGDMREVPWLYTIARAEWLECERLKYRMAVDPNSEEKDYEDDENDNDGRDNQDNNNKGGGNGVGGDGEGAGGFVDEAKLVRSALRRCAATSRDMSLPPAAVEAAAGSLSAVLCPSVFERQTYTGAAVNGSLPLLLPAQQWPVGPWAWRPKPLAASHRPPVGDSCRHGASPPEFITWQSLPSRLTVAPKAYVALPPEAMLPSQSSRASPYTLPHIPATAMAAFGEEGRLDGHGRWNTTCDLSRCAYAVLLSNSEGSPMPKSDHSPQIWTYFDYTHAMVRRMCALTALPIVVMVTADVNRWRRAALSSLCASVRITDVPSITIGGGDGLGSGGPRSGLNTGDNSRWQQTGSKLAPFNLTAYQAVMVLDSDTFMLHNADAAFCDFHQTFHGASGGALPLIRSSAGAAEQEQQQQQRSGQHGYVRIGEAVFNATPGDGNPQSQGQQQWRRTYSPPEYAAATLKSGELFSSVFLMRPDHRTYEALLGSLAIAAADADAGRRARMRPETIESAAARAGEMAGTQVGRVGGGRIGGGVGSPPPPPPALSDQDIMQRHFIGHHRMTCLEPQFNCRIHHHSRGLCYGLNFEGDVWASAAIIHAKLGECNLQKLLPRARALWLRNLPPGRSREGQRAAGMCPDGRPGGGG